MGSVSAKTALLLDGWYTLSALNQIVDTGEHGGISISDEPEDVRASRSALAREVRAFLVRAADLAEAFGVWTEPQNVASPHRVHVEADRVTGVEFAQEV